jgi:hypothetical protein
VEFFFQCTQALMHQVTPRVPFLYRHALIIILLYQILELGQ